MARSNHSHHHYHIGLIFLVILISLATLKFLSAKTKWHTYVVQSQSDVRQLKSANSVEDASAIAATIVDIPTGNPIFRQPRSLQAFVDAYSKQTGRDLVIVDNKEKILADTIPANVGTTYAEDEGDEVAKTIADGQPRDFIEKGPDYPNGISQTVISFKERGTVVGAIILSNSKIFE